MLSPLLQFALAWCSVAFAVGFADICWAKYSHAMGQGVAVKAGIWSAMIIITSAYSTVQYVGNHWLLSGALVGAFCGTFIGVRHSHKASSESAPVVAVRSLRYRLSSAPPRSKYRRPGARAGASRTI